MSFTWLPFSVENRDLRGTYKYQPEKRSEQTV